MSHENQVAQTILIVDDSPLDSLSLEAVLRATGNRNKVVALPGETAFRKYLDSDLEPPDILLIDMRLKDGSGESCINLANEHRKTAQRAAILAISSYMEEGVKDTAQVAGADGIIIKPITADALMEALRIINGFGWQIVRPKKERPS
jgi:DNA-binding NarL/FixJ family response regulator